MKKIILTLMAVILTIGSNAFAQGDLDINGQLRVGTSASNAKLNILSTSQNFGISLNQTRDTSGPSWGSVFFAFLDGSTLYSQESGGFINTLVYRRQSSSDSNSFLYGGLNAAYIGTTGGTGFIVDNMTALWVKNGIHSQFNSTVTLTNAYGIVSEGFEKGGIGGSVTVDDFRHIYIKDKGTQGGAATLSVTNQSGLWIDKQELGGTNNYGIVLNGDGAGADLVFGPTQTERIYSNAGRLYAQDSFGNQTILSPHDPDTGEWIYYSKNVKTGKVVRVDMERLVKAVEKLTGEQFMIETITE